MSLDVFGASLTKKKVHLGLTEACCTTCYTGDFLRKFIDYPEWGVVFACVQKCEGLLEEIKETGCGTLHLNFANAGPDYNATKKGRIADIIVKAAKEANIPVTWNGELDSCIVISLNLNDFREDQPRGRAMLKFKKLVDEGNDVWSSSVFGTGQPKSLRLSNPDLIGESLCHSTCTPGGV